MTKSETLSPAQKFRVRAALVPEGSRMTLSRADGLALAREWERCEQIIAAQNARKQILRRAVELSERATKLHDSVLKLAARMFFLGVVLGLVAGVLL